MKQINQISNGSTNLVFIHNSQAITTSLKIAEAFGTTHEHILGNIKKLTKMFVESTRTKDLHLWLHSYQGTNLYFLDEIAFVCLMDEDFMDKKYIPAKLNFIKEFHKIQNYIRIVTSKGLSPSNQSYNLKSDLEKLENDIQTLISTREPTEDEKNDFKQRIEKIKNTMWSEYNDIKQTNVLPNFFLYFALDPNNGLTKIGYGKSSKNNVWDFKIQEPNLEIIQTINFNSEEKALLMKKACEIGVMHKANEKGFFEMDKEHIDKVNKLKIKLELSEYDDLIGKIG